MSSKNKIFNFRLLTLEVIFKITFLLLLILPILYGYIYFAGASNLESKSFRTVQVEGDAKVSNIEMVSRPILSTELVKDWVSYVLLDLYNYTSTSYLDNIDTVRMNFTNNYASSFWNGYTSSVESGISTGVQIVDTIVSQKPITVKEATINGKRGWKFYVELYHVYKSEIRSDGIPSKSYLIVTVLEQDTKSSKKGVAIDHIKIK